MDKKFSTNLNMTGIMAAAFKDLVKVLDVEQVDVFTESLETASLILEYTTLASMEESLGGFVAKIVAKRVTYGDDGEIDNIEDWNKWDEWFSKVCLRTSGNTKLLRAEVNEIARKINERTEDKRPEGQSSKN